MNRYALVSIGCNFKIKIDEAKFIELKKARNVLLKALACEENYEIVVRNYLDLEKELSGIAIESIGRCLHDYYTIFNYIIVANIKISNLLNSARFHIDTLPGNVKKCLQDTKSQLQIEEVIRKEKSKNPHFKLVHFLLRNYLQHINLPTHNVSINKTWTKENLSEHCVNLFTLKEKISGDRKLKPIIDTMDEKVNLIFVIRHYIESISKIHFQARGLIEEKVEGARKCIQSAIDKYKESNTNSDVQAIGLSAFRLNKHNIKDDEVPLLLNWDDIRHNLIKKNAIALSNLHKMYATTRVDLGEKKAPTMR